MALVAIAADPARADDRWPDLRGPSSYTWVANRLSFPSAAQRAITSDRAGLGQVYQRSPTFAVSNIKLLFVNFFIDPTGTATPERCPGNDKTVDFATIMVGEAAYPVTFDGAVSTKLGDCAFVWSDPVRDATGAALTLAPNSTWFIRSSQSVAVGDMMTLGADYTSILPRLSHATLGDGVEYTSEPQTNKQTHGAIAAARGGSPYMGPAMAIGTGWDGSPVFLVLGDSIAAGVSDLSFDKRDHGAVGYIARALDDEASRRINFVNLAVPGTRPQVQSSTAPGQFALRAAVLRSIPNRPFNRLFSQMGQGGFGVRDLSEFKAAMNRWWTFIGDLCPSCPIYQTTFLPHARQGRNSFWTSVSEQVSNGEMDGYPDGLRWTANAWLRSGQDLPPRIRPIDVVPAFVEPGQPWAWRVPNHTWTLDAMAAYNDRVLRLKGRDLPQVGDFVVLEPGSDDAETRQIIGVPTPWDGTVQLVSGLKRVHLAGAAVADAITGDGTHPGTTADKAAAQILIDLKTRGFLN